MICPICGKKQKAVDIVPNRIENEVYRKYMCVNCNNTFFTTEFEVIENERFKEVYGEYQKEKLKYTSRKNKQS